ncbi:5-oxoprolinase subunit PxpA [Cytophagaceae bacterium DM2B3-1]|uniref:5-oxoprolinase subunit A n=1 Tax=Xanthocytophaga flava TaxID=3048013 RepID=A0ABT7CYN0_9BACT|nr:5-oxoprolinase subunit PxpA [Xanthocytophaga flavus]MDJ1498835.1 5-oxoprolinase subunit PxpA [Xanthocytophaga flavus]
MHSIDLNCDMGESFGPWKMGNDLQILNYVSSVNIACGFHAGDADTMRKTVAAAMEKNVAIGAHPGFPDLQGFGRRNMQLSSEEVYNIILYQIGALAAFVKVAGGRLHHVKPHGALYNMAAKDSSLSSAIAQAIKDFDPSVIVYGLSGSFLISESQKLGLKTASEVFADRTYQQDGSLTPRNQPFALIEDTTQSLKQVLKMVKEQQVVTPSTIPVPIQADTICIHGDGKHAVDFAQAINTLFQEHSITIQAI